MMESLAVGAGHGDGVASVSLLFGVLRLIALCFHSGVSEPGTVAQDLTFHGCDFSITGIMVASMPRS